MRRMNPVIRNLIEKEINNAVKNPGANSNVIERFGIKPGEDTILAYTVGFLISRFFDLTNEHMERDPNQVEINEFRDLLSRRIAEIRKE